MHGIVFKALKDFVVEEYDEATWRAIQEEADVAGRIYVPVTEYPDEEALALVGAASEVSDVPVPDLLYEFGKFIVPPLVQTYGVHVDGDWTGLDLLANVETYIHQALRAKRLSEFTPPNLGAKRLGEDRVVITYGSERGLCDLARGICAGVADFYGQTYDVTEHRCMDDGHDRCQIVVTWRSNAATDASAAD